ncbi:MAG: hypothetical protein H3C34_27220, partial [Caldilineaceae bacterium]|nr:hypothetical protein [Caldilineaceae bacterium]
MTQAFWWYLLAGFIIGFSISTLWEWLYFRRKRMNIENRRIAELEATVRGQMAAEGGPSRGAAGVDNTWAAADYTSPGVFLESEEEDIGAPMRPAAGPPPGGPKPSARNGAGGPQPTQQPAVSAASSRPEGAQPPRAETRQTSPFQSTSVPPAQLRRAQSLSSVTTTYTEGEGPAGERAQTRPYVDQDAARAAQVESRGEESRAATAAAPRPFSEAAPDEARPAAR